jgi:putative exporter of polyketide antibiotics
MEFSAKNAAPAITWQCSPARKRAATQGAALVKGSVYLTAIIFMVGIASVAAGTLPPAGPAGEVIWMILAVTGVITVMGLEAG